MKRLLPFLGLAALCCTPTAQGAPNKATLAHIHQQLNTLRQQQQATKTDQQHAVDALRVSEQSISHINRALADIQQQQQSTQNALDNLQHQIGSTQSRLQQEQQNLGVLLRQSWMNLAQPSTPSANWQDTQRNTVYAGLLAKQRQQTIAELQDTTHTLTRLSAQKQQLQTQLQQQKEAQEQQRKNLQAERATRQNILQKLGNQIARQQKAISTLEQNEKRITELMRALARAAAKRAAAKRAAAEHAAALHRRQHEHAHPRTGSATRYASLPAPKLSLNGLMRDKGHLLLPTRGELIHRFGTPREAGGTLWKGIFIKAPAGQAVVSVAAGEVVFSDWLRGFGNLIIIDHGDGYMSLYSDNETLYKRAGDTVKAGDVIASVGNTGGNSETGLYFELRYHSQAFDPDGWFGPHK